MVENLEINTVSCVQHPVEIDRLGGTISLCHRVHCRDENL